MPILRFQEHLQLAKLGFNSDLITFNSVELHSDKFVCVVEESKVYIVDIADPTKVVRHDDIASAIVGYTGRGMAFMDHQKVFGILDIKKYGMEPASLKWANCYTMKETVIFGKFISEDTLGLVTRKAVYHWTLKENSSPVKMFVKSYWLSGQIVDYITDPKQQYFLLYDNLGNMQLYSVASKSFEIIRGHAACFATFKMEGNAETSTLLCYAVNTSKGGKMHISEVGETPDDNLPFPEKLVDINLPETRKKFIFMQASAKYGVIYLITNSWYIQMFDIETGTLIYTSRLSDNVIYETVPHETTGGIMWINKEGRIMSATVAENVIVNHIDTVLGKPELAFRFAVRNNLPGAEAVCKKKFDTLFKNGQYNEAAKVAVTAPCGLLRTRETIQRFELLPTQPGRTSWLWQYLHILMDHGQLDKFESLKLCRLLQLQESENDRRRLLEKWLDEEKLECSEELGNLVRKVDPTLGLSVYVRADAVEKVIQCFADTGQFQKIVEYARKVGYTPDYISILRSVLQKHPRLGAEFASMLVEKNSPLADINQIVDVFMEKNMVQHCTTFLVDALKHNREEEGQLQTRLLEMNLMLAPVTADALLDAKIFSHYSSQLVAELCEKAGLLQRALEHYTHVDDIERVMAQAHLLSTDWLVDYFNCLSAEDSLKCLKAMLQANTEQNLQVWVQIATKYQRRLTVKSLVELLESFNTYEGLFYFLRSVINSSEDSEVHFKYIQAACKTGKIKEVETICRKSNSYDAEQVKNFLMDVKLKDPMPLIIVCERFHFVQELVLYLCGNGLQKYIEVYLKENSSRIPEVVGALLTAGAEDIIQDLMLGSCGSFSAAELISEVEKKNRLNLLRPWLESRVREGSTEPAIHNALAKINNDPGQIMELQCQERQRAEIRCHLNDPLGIRDLNARSLYPNLSSEYSILTSGPPSPAWQRAKEESEYVEQCFCVYCMEPYSNSRSNEKWVQCLECNLWAHEVCTVRELWCLSQKNQLTQYRCSHDDLGVIRDQNTQILDTNLNSGHSTLPPDHPSPAPCSLMDPRTSQSQKSQRVHDSFSQNELGSAIRDPTLRNQFLNLGRGRWNSSPSLPSPAPRSLNNDGHPADYAK